MNDNTFIVVPPHILADKNLLLQEKMLFGLINGLTTKHGYCFATNGYLGDQIGLSDGRVSKHISKLEKKGYLRLEITKIKKEERTGQTGEKYGTIRHIYVYQFDETTNPLVVNDQPPLVVHDQYIVKNLKERVVVPPPQKLLNFSTVETALQSIAAHFSYDELFELARESARKTNTRMEQPVFETSVRRFAEYNQGRERLRPDKVRYYLKKWFDLENWDKLWDTTEGAYDGLS